MIIEQLKQPGPFLILSLLSQTIKVLFHLLGFPTEVHLATSNSIFYRARVCFVILLQTLVAMSSI